MRRLPHQHNNIVQRCTEMISLKYEDSDIKESTAAVWRLVYKDGALIIKIDGTKKGSVTSTKYDIEEFKTEVEMLKRIDELGLVGNFLLFVGD